SLLCPAGLVRNIASLSGSQGDTPEAGWQAGAQDLRFACLCSSRACTCNLCRSRGLSSTAWARCESGGERGYYASSARLPARGCRLRRGHCSSALLPGTPLPGQVQDLLLADPQNAPLAALQHRQLML